jgi:L-rhamnose mutarotase
MFYGVTQPGADEGEGDAAAVGAAAAGDVARMQADPATRRWWALTDPCQEPLASHAEGEWWAPMVEVFHTD